MAKMNCQEPGESLGLCLCACVLVRGECVWVVVESPDLTRPGCRGKTLNARPVCFFTRHPLLHLPRYSRAEVVVSGMNQALQVFRGVHAICEEKGRRLMRGESGWLSGK